MNMNSLVSSFRASLRGFFEFCEEQKGVKADVLNALFNQYFALKKTHELSDSESDADSDDETDVSSSKKAPAKEKVKKAAPEKKADKTHVKATARSGKGKDSKPRNEQTPVTDLDLNKKDQKSREVNVTERTVKSKFEF